MAGTRISALPNALGSLVDSDLLVFVDFDDNSTRQTTVANLKTSFAVDSVSNATSAVVATLATNATSADSATNCTTAVIASLATTATTSANIDVINNPVDTTMYPVLVGDDASSSQAPAIINTLSFNASTGTLSATAFVGDGSGLTGIVGGGGSSDVLRTESINTAGTYYLTFVGTENAVDSVNTDTDLTYNPDTNTLTVVNLAGNATSADSATNCTTAVTATFATSAGSATTAGSASTATSATSADSATNCTTAVIATTATVGNTVPTTAVTNNATYYPLFVSSSTNSNQSANLNGNLRYNPNSAGERLSLAADGAIFSLGANDDFELEHDAGNSRNVIRTDAFQLFVMNATDSARAMFDNNGDLHAEGDLIAFSTTIVSDPRFKENIESIGSPLEKLSEINGVTWNWKRNGERGAGVISTDVKKVLPEAVKTRNTLNTKTEYEAVNYDAIIGLLVESVKELKKEIEELKTK